MSVILVKNDKTEEPYDPKKIIRVVTAAGMDKKKAEKLSKNITKWIKKQKTKKISSQEIRDEVKRQLKEMDEYAYRFYIWYKKTEDNNSNNIK